MKRQRAGLDNVKAGVDSLSKRFVSLTGRVGAFATKLSGISMTGAGFKSMAGEAADYNDQIRILSTTVGKYGVGVTSLEGRLDRLAKTMHLTRKETMQLMRGYEQSVNSFSLDGFEKTIRQIQRAVGPNSDAIREMMDVITSLTREKMPDLERAMQNINQSGNAQRVREASRLLLLTGDINQAEYKRIQEYIRGSSQMSNADKARMAQIERQQQAMKKFDTSLEQIRLSIGRALLPLFESLGNWFERNSDTVERFFNGVAGAAERVGDIMDSLLSKFGLLSVMAVGAAPSILSKVSAIASPITGGIAGGFGKIPKKGKKGRWSALSSRAYGGATGGRRWSSCRSRVGHGLCRG
ncbi:MAG: hypothetical protein HC888_01845 [Candidatus Competibacteraceae bacterium]|nr:hypothetical protein [Candidatus Competibacteraceae bacterium]